MPCYVCNPFCGRCRPQGEMPASLKGRYMVRERKKKPMDYRLCAAESTELQRTYEVDLTAEETKRLVDEIYAFLAMQAGVEYLADQSAEALAGRFGDDLGKRVASCLANQCADKIIAAEGLAAALEPVVRDSSEIGEGASFSCKVLIHVKPELELSSYEPVSLPIPAFTVSPEMVERNVRAIVEDRARYVDDESAACVSPSVKAVISLRTEKCGMEVQPLTFESIVYQMGSGILPQQIDDALAGMEPGETKKFSFTVTSKNFLGLDVEEEMDSTLSVLRIVKKETPELTDAWVKGNVPGAHDVEGFYELVRGNLSVRARADYDRLKDEAASAALAERLPELELPDLYYDYARAGLLQNVSAALARKGMSEEEFYLAQGVTSSQFMIQMSARAREVLRQGLALDALARHEGFEVGEADLDRAARAISPRDHAGARKMLEMNGRTYQLREMALRQKARAVLSERAVVQGVEAPVA
ncbi:trigger factor [Adlercreutzia sp. ZJ242]|uniref:trigger factor n=1 Tax=Adlercreutzia sp. ZJ242 TaxID=2709409 RepID=UPI0013EB3B0A|nr:trigger factor [Adlercreutzia sp. ZJ242]